MILKTIPLFPLKVLEDSLDMMTWDQLMLVKGGEDRLLETFEEDKA